MAYIVMAHKVMVYIVAADGSRAKYAADSASALIPFVWRSYRPSSHGLQSCGLYNRGLFTRLYSYGLYRYGLCMRLFCVDMAYVVMASAFASFIEGND